MGLSQTLGLMLATVLVAVPGADAVSTPLEVGVRSPALAPQVHDAISTAVGIILGLASGCPGLGCLGDLPVGEVAP